MMKYTRERFIAHFSQHLIINKFENKQVVLVKSMLILQTKFF